MNIKALLSLAPGHVCPHRATGWVHSKQHPWRTRGHSAFRTGTEHRGPGHLVEFTNRASSSEGGSVTTANTRCRRTRPKAPSDDARRLRRSRFTERGKPPVGNCLPLGTNGYTNTWGTNAHGEQIGRAHV